MDCEKIIYTNERGESLEFSVKSSFHCNVSKDVTGISDIRNTIYSSSSMGQHGDTYIGQRIEPRDIEITGSINTKDKEKALSLRRKVIKIMNPELSATLTYVYKDFKRVIDCKIDNAPVFTRKSVFVDYTIQLTCLNPFWREETETKEDIAAWVSAFEFECEIDATDGMIFGYRELSVIVDCYNEGDISTGMKIVFTAIGTVVNPILLNVDTQQYIQINATLVAGDVVTINTEYGQKGAALLRGGATSDYFRYIDVDSTFMQLQIGDNIFRYDAAEGADALEASIYYSNKYLGV